MRLGELQGLQTISARIAGACDLEGLLSEALRALDELLGLEHTMVLVLDDDGSRLVALGSHGYGESGLGPAGSGAEVEVGAGVIGTAAATRRLVRVAGIGSGLSYGRAVRDRQQALTPDHQLPPQIALPGLPDAQAQLALPMLVGSELVGVLAAESRDPLAFDEWDEAFLQIVANQIGVRIRSFDDAEDEHDAARPPADTDAGPAATAQARRHFVFYPHDDAVFVDGEYLIRNVPGRILWKILTGFVADGRRELSNRELRLDRSLGLPTYRDNLESRLILLRKRLQDRCPDVRLVPVRRGRFALETDALIELEERRE
jgi:putative methionine-R-sulfoxide reductase with GAF domain